jgi:hypothetical protein
MKLTPINHELDLLPPSTGRSTGLHVSDIYNSLFAELEPDRYKNTGGPNTTKMAMGLAWETYLERCLEQAGINAARPGEFTTREGVAFSPDLLIFNGHDRLGEIKLTFMSESDALDEPKFAKWHTQAMAYCHHLGIPFVRFYVLFVNGNYRQRQDPILRPYEIEYSARELKENWQTLMNHAKHKRLL